MTSLAIYIKHIDSVIVRGLEKLVPYTTAFFFFLIQVAWAALGIARMLVSSLPLSERLGAIEGEKQFP